MFWITLAFILGLFIGAFIGVATMAFVTAGNRMMASDTILTRRNN